MCGLKRLYEGIKFCTFCHTLYGCVDWNSNGAKLAKAGVMSHPVWVCGLKPMVVLIRLQLAVSHPVWVCGLKPAIYNRWLGCLSHTLYGCVDWNHHWPSPPLARAVTPCMGVWIETRGKNRARQGSTVTPCMGVWIETQKGLASRCSAPSHPVWVCGLKPGVGVW